MNRWGIVMMILSIGLGFGGKILLAMARSRVWPRKCGGNISPGYPGTAGVMASFAGEVAAVSLAFDLCAATRQRPLQNVAFVLAGNLHRQIGHVFSFAPGDLAASLIIVRLMGFIQPGSVCSIASNTK